MASSHEKDAICALYERHARDVHRFAWSLTGDAARADDLASEAFVRAWAALDETRTETVKAYLFAIVRNLVRETARKRSSDEAGLDADRADTAPGPAASADGRMELDATLKALQRLPEPDRAALLMRAHDGMSHEEIARALGISVVAARVKVHRARIELARLKLLQERLP